MIRATLMKAVTGSALAAVIAAGMATPAAAETNKVRLAEQFGLLYVPLNVVVDRKLIEKHAKLLGLPAPKVELYKISGGANINKALLANQLDFGAAGVGPALKLWGKTEGRFKAAFNMTDMPLKLITNDPGVKKIEDYLTIKDHKIATPAAKVSIQAVVLQMAAQRIWHQADKLDHLVVSMKHPTALAAILSGGQTVKSHFATLPYSYEELKSGKAHEVTNSYKLLGGEHTALVMIAGKDFKEANPKTFQAVSDAFLESYDWIDKHPAEAAEIFIRATKTKLDPAAVKAMIADHEEVRYTGEPKMTMEFAKFLHGIGDIPEAKTWKDYYWENNYKQNGS
jgi:NitT/TauT family transport system substrate-binding protein